MKIFRKHLSGYWGLKKVLYLIKNIRNIRHVTSFIFFKLWSYVLSKNYRYTKTNPMDTSSSICHRFDVEIPRGKFVEITSILKGESTWKLWHRFDVDSTFKIDEISMSSPRGFFYVASTSNRRNFCTRCFHFLTFSALGTYSKLFWYNTESL